MGAEGAVKADEYAIPSGVDIFPAGQLAPGVQLAVRVRTEQFAVTKADGRATTRLVDRDTAELLETFQRGPVTLVQARAAP